MGGNRTPSYSPLVAPHSNGNHVVVGLMVATERTGVPSVAATLRNRR